MEAETPRVRRRLSLLVVAVTCAVAGSVFAGAQVLATGTSARSVPATVPRLSVMTRPPTSADVLPRFTLKGFIATRFANWRAARSVGTHEGARFFAIPGKDRGLCLLEVRREAKELSGFCGELKALDDGINWFGIGNDDGTMDIAALVVDGFDRVKAEGTDISAPVEDNAVFLTVSEKQEWLRLVRPDGSEQRVFLWGHPPE